MKPTSAEFGNLVRIFNFDTKRDLEKFCAGITVDSHDFAAMLLGAQAGVFHPYLYANHFRRTVPDCLAPTEKQISAFHNNGRGPWKSKEAQTFARKTFQMFKDQRAQAAHLFYTPGGSFWHLFYFDQRDRSAHRNHWDHGPHIHLISSLWPRLKLADVWDRVQRGDLSFPNKIHLRFRS